MKEITGDLVELAKQHEFDVIVHGCNCFCTMKKGLALQMAKEFECDKFDLESDSYKGSIDKLGQIEFHEVFVRTDGSTFTDLIDYHSNRVAPKFIVVNAYTQYEYGTHTPKLDYDALTLCLRKVNHTFKGKHIGLPQIGCGLAGGKWNIVKQIIQQELKDCTVTIVNK